MTCRLGKGQGEEKMLDTLRIVSDAIEKRMSEKERDELLTRIYGALSGGHFDEEFAAASVAKMYFTEKDGTKRRAPFWTASEVAMRFEKVKERLPKAYNVWDFFVTVQMVASDNWLLLKTWWPEITNEEIFNRVIDLAVNWLDDADNPFGTSKIWDYLHPVV